MLQEEKEEGYDNISETLKVNWKKKLGKWSFGEIYAGEIAQRGKFKECAVKIMNLNGRS